MISTITASVVIRPHHFIKAALRKSAKNIAHVEAEKNIASSAYQRNLPGLKTNQRFMSQQNTFAMTKPIEVAIENLKALTASDISADGNDKNLTAQSSADKHFRHVAARR